MTGHWITRTTLAVALLLGIQITGHGQAAPASSDLRTQLRERYDVVALQEGVALVPRQSGGSVRMIQIVDGVVTVDSEALTGRQLRDRLGRDADLVLQVSYLDRQQQRELAGAVSDASSAPGSGTQTADTIERTEVTTGDVVRLGGSVTVRRNERVQGDVVAIGGSADIEGEVSGDVSSIGGSVTLGPQAVVRGDVNVVGGTLNRAPGARVFGSVDEVGAGPRSFRRGWRLSDLFGSFWSRLGSLTATVLRLTLLVLFGVVAVAFGRNPIERIAARTAASPLRSGLIGLLAEILFLPVLILTVVVLAVSIVGIPLLALMPFAVLLVILVMLVGFLGLAYHIGRQLTSRFGWTERGAYAAVAIGVVAIGALTLVAKVAALAGGFLLGAPLAALGYVVEYVAWTVGFGATILAWYETQTRFGPGRHAATAPPMATPPTPSPTEA
jgi:hypothetical protein